MSLSNKQINHFARQLILKDFGEKKQKILFKSHVTFIGIGGINSPALLYLLAVGIKNITLIDYDKVQASNLNRQIIYSLNDIGKNKISCVKKYIKNNYSKINLLSFNKKINKKNCFKLLKNTDVVIDGTDNWETMLTINDHCVKKSIPLLSASVSGYDGNLTLFNNIKEKHLCLRCIFPYQKKLNLPRCETTGVLGTSAGIIGLLSAQKIVNFLTIKKSSSVEATMTYFDSQKLSIKNINIGVNSKCKFYR